jgi:hypothetical protein
MRIFVEHNAQGEIRSVALPATVRDTDGVTINLRLLPSPGFFVSEVEAEHVQHDRHFEALRGMKYTYRIEGHPFQPHLVRK